MHQITRIETILWSIAVPGFGQILNKKYTKGFIFIALEFLININSHLNMVIISSFHGEILAAIHQVDYQWLMFYPCFYMFTIWDAYKDAVKEKELLSFLPFVLAAYLGTIGVTYSASLKVLGVLLGPVWLPLVFIFLGLIIGFIIKSILEREIKQIKFK